MNRAEMMEWFAHNEAGFGPDMDENKVTALLGAHSLGGASKENSGFEGTWTPGENRLFTHEFYRRLVDPWIFTNTILPNGKFQWETCVFGNSCDFMLNTDIELIVDIDVNGHVGRTCNPGVSTTECPAASTKSLVEQFSRDKAEFFKQFKVAYELMMKAKPKSDPNILTPPK
jgi:catalase (peroxidase I)